MRRFFKTVLFAGVPFGVLMGLAGAESLSDFVTIAIVFGAMFGVVLGAILSAAQWWTGRRSRSAGEPAQRRARAERTVFLEMSLADAYRRCLDVAMSVFGTEAVDQGPDSTTIAVRTGTSWKSWGEEVTLELSADDAARTIVSITSRPKVRTTIFDYGKNRHNVERVANRLISEIEQATYGDRRSDT